MKLRNASILLLVVGALLCASVPAQGEGKVGWVQFAVVLEGTEEAKVKIGEVRAFVEAKEQEYQGMVTELNQLKAQFEQQRLALNAETQAEMQASIQEKERLARRFQEDTQAEINSRRDKLFGQLSAKVQTILTDYAKTNNYKALLFLDQLQGYFDPQFDVTQEIIRIYNEKNPVAGSAP